MKLLSVALLVASLACPSMVFAEGVSSHKVCSIMFTLAQWAMATRQHNESVVDALEIIQQSEYKKLEKPFKGLLIEAHKRPRFVIPQQQEDAIMDFANEIYLQCINYEEQQ